MTLTVGSLCTGTGQLERALTLAGIDIDLKFVADPDPAASTLLALRHPTVPNLGDIKQIDWAEIEPPHILCAGFPCQDVSTAGLGAGITDGTRSGLWLDVAWAINSLRPPYVLIENVEGLLSARADSNVEPCPWCLGNRGGDDEPPVLRALGAVLGDLSDLGYDAQWVTVAASDVGAAHRRRRVFILAADTSRVGHGDTWAESFAGVPASAVGGAAAPGGVTLLPTPRTSDANGAGAHGHGGPEIRTTVAMLPTPAASRSGRQKSASEGAAIRPSLDMITHLFPTPDATHGRKTTRTGQQRAGAVELPPTPRATDGTNGGPNQRGSKGDLMLPSAVHLLPTPRASERENRQTKRSPSQEQGTHGLCLAAEVLPQHWGAYAPAVARWEQVMGRPAPDPTEPGRSGPQLAPRFVEWLMGHEDGWVTGVPGLTRNQQLRLLGNGVVALQGAEAIRRLAATP